MSQARILLCHNYYQQRGGEDESFEAEADLLEANGHEVYLFTRHNDAIEDLTQLSVAGQTLWSRKAAQDLEAIIDSFQPTVMMCTNIFPLLSPAIYSQAKKQGVAVIQQLRNYRIFCVNGLFLRDQQACHACLHKRVAWPGVMHRCYRDSRLASTLVAGWQQSFWHTAVRKRGVDLFVAPTQYTRGVYVSGGIDADHISVRPIVTQPMSADCLGEKQGYAVYVGRLSEEKGIASICEAWKILAGMGIPLHIVGDGPEAPRVKAAADRGELIWHGWLDREKALARIAKASVVLVPSICPEPFGRVVVESFAAGTPVIASEIGSLPELVQDGTNGLRFQAGDVQGLVTVVRRMFETKGMAAQLGQAALASYDEHYSQEQIYQLMLTQFEMAVGQSQAKA